MNISICKWYNNSVSPVLFFIDDLANVWVDTNGNGKIDLGEDWGYAKNSENSSFRFLNEVILRDFPKVKATFFVPVGVRVGIIENPTIKSVSKMINCDEETKNFFKAINDNFKYEIAYHGTTHGQVGKRPVDFRQEWELFKSVDEAIDIINNGREIYRDVFGCYPKGGKYCGYKNNQFSDESIDKSNFLWWSRYWNRGILDDGEKEICGNETNLLSHFDIRTFGENDIIDIPSTVNGGLLTSVFNTNLKSIKGIAKIILKEYLIKRRLKELNYLLQNNLVISIQEHIAPSRDDGRRQTPNIFDDKTSLNYIFNYLKDKDVWYCTGTELAEYYLARKNIKINKTGECEFEFINFEDLLGKKLSIIVDKNFEKLQTPNGDIVQRKNTVFNFIIEKGKYKFLY